MTDKKPIIIDLCKIGWCAWIIISAFLVFCFVSEESANLTWKDIWNSKKGDFVYNGTSWSYDKNAVVQSEMECYQGILDKVQQCQTSTDDTNGFLIASYLFLGVNCINGYLWFVALNRKYGKYEFKFKACGDSS